MLKSRRKKVIAISGICLLTLFVISYSFYVQPKMYCWHEDIDINSGRTRLTRYILFCKVNEHVRESVFSQTLSSEYLADKKPDWQRGTTFSLAATKLSDCHYRKALFQMKAVSWIWTGKRFSIESKRQIAQRFLFLWQTDGGCYTAEKYLHDLEGFVEGHASIKVEVADLPVLFE